MYYMPSFVLDIFALIIALLLFSGNIRQSSRTYARTLFGALTLLLAMLLVTEAMGGMLNAANWAGARFSHETARFIHYLLMPVFGWTFLLYTDYWVESSEERLMRRQYLYGIPMLLGIVGVVVNLPTGWLYYIDADNSFVRGAYFSFGQLVFALYIVYSAGLALLHACREQMIAKKHRYRCIALFLIPSAVAIGLQTFLPDIPLICPAMSITLLMVYINIQQQRTAAHALASDRQRKHTEALESELMQSRISIMLSQIQPHFLYNSLTTIVDLCDTDAKLAKRATIAFSQYLRGNMDSLKQTMPVPFSVEQKHIENYLWLEKLRFGDELTIVWDIQVSDFKLPSLSVQPLVENAVKYGVGKKPGGGTVSIATRESPHVYRVIVTDDGVGYNVMETQSDGRTHIGIDNVRSRLHYMCGGALTIQSEAGKGTVATITLLKEEPA